MNERVWIAQADTTPVQAPVPLKVVSVVKPGSEQAITIDLGTDQKTKLDLSSIANEKMTMVHVGTKLIILFDNHSTVTIEPFFDSTGKPLADLDVALGGRDVSGQEFASLFPITEDQSVLPAAGNGGTPSSGADFHGSTVEALSTGNPLALLGQENSGGGSEPDAQNPAILQDNAPTLTGAFSAVTVLEADLDTHQDGSDLAAGARTGTDPDASGETATASCVTFKAGSQAMDVVFGDMATAVVKDEAGHTLTITWVVSPNGTHVEGFLPGSDHPAIIIQLGDGTTAGNHTDANGTISPIITITLTDAFPHAGGAADNSIAITGISVVGIDSVPASDGTRQSVSTTIEIHITDDAPVLIGGGEDSPPHVADHAVGEDGLTGANLSDGSYDAVNNAGVSDAALNVDWGADDAIHHALDDTGRELAFNIVGGVPVDGAGHALALTSNGVGLQYVVTELTNGGQQLDAYRGDVHDVQTLIFTVTLDPTSQHGSYSFTLSGNLDHPASGTSGDELPLDFGVTATDSDGDQVATHFTVNVQDDTPTAGEATDTRVNEDDLPNGNDLFKETRTVQGDLAVHWGADNGDARHILIAENGLPTVTSDGVSVVYQTTVDADGNAVVMAYKAGGSASNPSDQVFSLSFNEDGSGTYTFRLLGNIDHAVGSDDKALNFTIDAYDSDGDHVTQSFTVDVADDHAIAIGTILTRSVEEEELPHGNEDTRGANDGDLTVLGFPVDITTAHADGLLNILWGADSANTHANGGFDGTQINGDRSVVFGGTGGAYIGDAAYVADSAHPADADTVSQFLRVTSSGNPVDLATLTSGGVPLEYVLSANGTVLTAYAGATHDNAHAVFEVTLSDTGVGSYNFQLLGVLDHPVHGTSANQEDTLSFNFTFTARDGDGDVAQNNFIVNIIDDSPVAGTGTASKVEDESLPGGNNETETPNLSASVTGVSLNIAWGADDANPTNHGGLGDRSVAFTDSNVVVSGAYNGAVLTSLGQTVSYTVLSDGTLVGYTGSAPSSTASGNVVFYVSLSDQNSGEYNFTLVKPLDQSAGGGENSLSLTFNYTATDSDGDTSNAHFKVTVVDDVPTLDATPIPTRVVEEEQPIVAGPGNEDSSGAGDADHVDFIFPFIHDDTTEKATGSLGVNWGADSANDNNGQPGDRSVQFVNVADPAGLTSRGEAVHYMVTTSGGQQTLVAYTGLSGAPHVVFTVGLSDASAHGTYTFTLKDVLDQHGAGEDTLNLSFQFTATDSDGDTTGIGTFTVGVIDDTPIAVGTIAPRYVEEEALSGGNEDAQPLGVEIAGAIANGGPITDHIGASLNIAWGGDDSNNLGNVGFNGTQADGDRSVVFGGTNGAYVHDTDATHQLTLGDVAQFLSVSGGGVTLATLTSGGEHLVYTLSNNGTVLTASTETSHQAVFTVTLSDAGSGSYNFVLNGVLDHPVHGTSASQEDVLSFNFTFTAHDSDGDVAQNNFTVNVIDDSPIIGAGMSKATIDEDGLLKARGDQVNGNNDSQPGDVTVPNSDNDANEATATGTLNIKWGADNHDIDDTYTNASGFKQDGEGRSVTFTNTNVGIAGAADLTGAHLSSHGDQIVFSLTDNDTRLVGIATRNGFERTVIEVTLSDDGTGAYHVILHDALDQALGNNENNITLTFNYTASDADGDTAHGSFQVVVNDDVPVFTGQTATSSVNEGDMFTLTTVSSHTLNFSSTGLSATHLHAGGGAGVGVVSYGGNSNLQGPDQNPGAKTLILTADSGTTFTLGSVALGLFGTSGGSMTVTLKGYDADNHLVATATFDAQSVGGNPAAVITSIFNSASSDPNHAFLNVQISTLEIIPPPGYAGRVVIDNLGVTETTTTITSTPHAVDTVVDLTSLVSMGADSPGTWSVAPFSAQQVHFTQGTSVDPATYNGTPIMLSSSDGHTIVAMAGTEVIFTLTVSASGQATFELLKPIDGGTLRSIDFSQLITVTDSDGDPLTLASGDFVIDINSMNHLPTVSAAAISVNEAGLPDGSNHGDGSNTNTGTIVLNPGDGPSHVTIDNVLVTHTGQEFESSLGTLTITSITATAIGYSYVLHTTTSGTGTDDTFSIVVTDSDHDTQSTTLTINIGDDGPSAKADTDGTVEGRTLHVAVADGVLHNDVSGADGYNATGAVVGVRVADSDLTTAASGHVGTALTGHYGTLTLNTDGSYDYKSDPNLVPSEGATETFVYTIEDGDGSLSTTTLKIALTDSTPHPVGVEKTVDEAGLTDGSAPSAPATKATGDLVLGDTDTPHVTHILGANGESDITGTTVSVNGLYGTLTLDQSGHYTYTLTSPFHTTPGNNDGANVETGKDVFTYTVTDAYGNTNTSSISIDIKDDVPVANFVSATMGENDDKTVALHAGTDFIYGADGAGTLTLGAISVTGAYTPADLSGLDISLNGTDIVIKPGTTFDPLNAGQSSTIHIQYAVTDSDGDIKTNEVTVQVNGVTDNQSPTVNGETIFVDYDASREAAPSWYDPNGSKYAFSIPTLALLWNDSDPDHDVLSITSVSGSGATLSADGQYVLFPTNASGSFHYTVFDGVNHVDAIATINLVADASGKATSGADFLIDNSQVGPNFVGGAGGDILVENSLNGGNLFGDSQFNPDNLSSGSGNDLLIGSDTQGDNIYGGKGDDTLWGRGGADTMFGDVGNDTLIGGAGADKMTGGAGADHFRYTALTDGGTVASGDHIVDFSGHDGQGDVIDLLSSVFGGGLGAIANVDLVQVANGMNLTATAGPTAVDMGSAHFAYQQSSGQLFYDSDGGGAANRVLIAILENNAAVQATDIHKVAG